MAKQKEPLAFPEVTEALEKLKATDAAKAEIAAVAVTRIDDRAARKVKVVKADGSIAETDSAQLFGSLLQQAGLQAEIDPARQRDADNARRARGEPDRCEDCGNSLSMSRGRVRQRDAKGRPWRCVSCAKKHHYASPEASHSAKAVERANARRIRALRPGARQRQSNSESRYGPLGQRMSRYETMVLAPYVWE